MPEATDTVATYLYLNKTDIAKLTDVMACRVEFATLSNGATVTKDKNGDVEIEAEQEVTVEFELSDYARDYP